MREWGLSMIETSRLRTFALVLAMPLAVAACANADKTASVGQPMPREKVRELVRKEAKAQGVPTSLALAVAQVESGFNPLAKSPVGAASLVLMLADRAESSSEPKPLGVVMHDESNRMVVFRIFSVDGARFVLTAAARGRPLLPNTLDPIVGKLEIVLARRTFAA